MPRRNPPAKWVLPDVIDPPERICFQISVPNNRLHLAAFRGALWNLASAINWQDDPAHKAKDVAQVWRKIYDQVVSIACELPPASGAGGGVIIPMFRQNPDNACQLQVSLGNDCWCTIFDASLCNPNPTQPGSGGPGRPGPGQFASDCYTLQANQALNLPFAVYPGDTLEITSADGAGWDGNIIDSWDCPNGQPYYFGNCTGVGHLDGADPLPTVLHMRLLFLIGGTYVDAMGGAVTVGGSGAQSALVVVNDSALNDNSGSYKICVKLTNNQTAAWSHTFDFTTNAYSSFWSINVLFSTNIGHWVAGSGYHSDPYIDGGGGHFQSVAIKSHVASTNFDTMHWEFTYSQGLYVDATNTLDLLINGTDVSFVTGPTVPTSPRNYLTAAPATTDILFGLTAGVGGGTPPGGTAIITKLTITGHGADPYIGV